jgi:hypothetical protein
MLWFAPPIWLSAQKTHIMDNCEWPSWSWSYDSWIYNYIYNRWPSSLTLWVRIPPSRGVLDTTLFDKVCQWLAAGLWSLQFTT